MYISILTIESALTESRPGLKGDDLRALALLVAIYRIGPHVERLVRFTGYSKEFIKEALWELECDNRIRYGSLSLGYLLKVLPEAKELVRDMTPIGDGDSYDGRVMLPLSSDDRKKGPTRGRVVRKFVGVYEQEAA